MPTLTEVCLGQHLDPFVNELMHPCRYLIHYGVHSFSTRVAGCLIKPSILERGALLCHFCHTCESCILKVALLYYDTYWIQFLSGWRLQLLLEACVISKTGTRPNPKRGQVVTMMNVRM
jgi:hypothetical protein